MAAPVLVHTGNFEVASSAAGGSRAGINAISKSRLRIAIGAFAAYSGSGRVIKLCRSSNYNQTQDQQVHHIILFFIHGKFENKTSFYYQKQFLKRAISASRDLVAMFVKENSII